MIQREMGGDAAEGADQIQDGGVTSKWRLALAGEIQRCYAAVSNVML